MLSEAKHLWLLVCCIRRKKKIRDSSLRSERQEECTSVSKMAHTGEYHCHLALVSRGNHFFVTNRAARLNRAGCASFGRRHQPVRERKKGIARDRAALERKPGLVCFPNGYPRSVDPRHLAGANSKCPV